LAEGVRVEIYVEVGPHGPRAKELKVVA
jgi:cold shock CspA family protein